MIELKSMAVTMPEVVGHPNRKAFHGVLTMVDVASERAPAGSKGHRVMLTKRAAEAALPSLLGMALDYSPSLDRHDVRCKVGVITRADIVGRNVELGGYLFARDFPEIVEEIAKGRPGENRQNVNASWRDAGLTRPIQSAADCRNSGFGVKQSLLAAAGRIFSLASLMRGDSKASSGGVAGFCSRISAEAWVRTNASLGLDCRTR